MTDDNKQKLSKKSKTSKKTILLRVLAVILFIVGIILVFNGPIQEYFVKQNQTSTLQGLTKKTVAANQKKKECLIIARYRILILPRLRVHV